MKHIVCSSVAALLMLCAASPANARSPAIRKARLSPQTTLLRNAATARSLPGSVSKPGRAILDQVVALLTKGDTNGARAAFERFAKLHFKRSTVGDRAVVVDWVLRQVYLGRDPKLRASAERAASRTAAAAAVQRHVDELRRVKRGPGPQKRWRALRLQGDRMVPARVPPENVTTPAALDAEIAKWEATLQTTGDDAQLANIDLQNALQKQQQTMTVLSNVSKALHDTAMGVIRNLR